MNTTEKKQITGNMLLLMCIGSFVAGVIGTLIFTTPKGYTPSKGFE